MNIINKPYNGNSSSRSGSKIETIVIHIAVTKNGGIQALHNWANNPNNKQSSWHFGVSKIGEIFSYVPTNLMAWHAGLAWKNGVPYNPRGVQLDINRLAEIVKTNKNINPNRYTIGIEHEGNSGETWTQAMYEADADLIISLSKQFSIPLDRKHILGHFDIDYVDRPNCPGAGFNFNILFQTIEKKLTPTVPVPPITPQFPNFKEYEQVNPMTFKNDAIIYDKPSLSSETLGTIRELDGKVLIKGELNTTDGIFYMSQWSFDQWKNKGMDPNWLSIKDFVGDVKDVYQISINTTAKIPNIADEFLIGYEIIYYYSENSGEANQRFNDIVEEVKKQYGVVKLYKNATVINNYSKADPCEKIRQDYETQKKQLQNANDRIKELENLEKRYQIIEKISNFLNEFVTKWIKKK